LVPSVTESHPTLRRSARTSLLPALRLPSHARCGTRVIVRETSDHVGDNLVTLNRIYMAAQRNLGRPARNVEDLRAAAKEYGDLDHLLISPNDGQPYAIVWGVDLGNAPNPTMVVAHEKVGAGGV